MGSNVRATPRLTMTAEQIHQHVRAIGERLREIRERQGISATDIAKALECHVSAVYNTERATHGPTLAKLIAWCDVLGADVLVRERIEPSTSNVKEPESR